MDKNETEISNRKSSFDLVACFFFNSRAFTSQKLEISHPKKPWKTGRMIFKDHWRRK